MSGLDPKIALLRTVPGLAQYHDRQLAHLAPMMNEMTFPVGMILTREATPGTACFLIVEGEAAVTLRGTSIGRIGPGEFAGEMALLDHNPRSATVVAATELRVLSIEPASFATLLQQPGALRAMLIATARRLRDCQSAPTYDRPYAQPDSHEQEARP